MQEQSLNVLQHGLEYLQACYIPDPSGYGSQYGDVYVYQVGDVKREMRFWRRPEDIEVRPQPPPHAPPHKPSHVGGVGVLGRCPGDATDRSESVLVTRRHTHAHPHACPHKRARMQKPEPVFVTAGIEQPTDLTAHMTAGIVSSTLALHRYGRLSRVEALRNIDGVKGLYNVTVDTAGVLKHYRSLWRSDSFYDDKLWAVRCCIPLLKIRLNTNSSQR